MSSRSEELFSRSRKIIPGGVNSPVRAFKAVGGQPIFVKSAKGSKIYDVDGRAYVDYVGSYGPMILGHAHPEVIEALRKALEAGTSYGAPTELELELAQIIVEAVPSIEMVRMVSSGTEATMTALRLARGYTGRDKIVKFAGCYHGHGDSLLVKAGSGAATLGVPDSPGVPADLARNTLVARFNDASSLREIFHREGEQIACVIVEPIIGNMGCIPPADGFLQEVRSLCTASDSLLIFDEVITGFRVGYGGAQALYGVRPDLTTLGKIIGGGLPVGAYGGKREIMEQMAPVGAIYQAGTLSGNPLAMTAGIATLKLLRDGSLYQALEEKARTLGHALTERAEAAGIPTSSNRVGSMLSLFFTDSKVVDDESAISSDTARFGRYFSSMLRHGVYLAPSQFETAFVSAAHTDEDLERTIEAADRSFRSLT